MNRFVTAMGRLAAGVAVASLLVASPVAAQTGTVTGTITDASNGAGVQSVQVYLVDSALGTLSNANGRFLILNVPAGSYTLRAERLGYATQDIQVNVSAGGTVAQNFQLESEALGLDEIVVTGTAGAARRREIGNTIASVAVADIAEPPANVDAHRGCARPRGQTAAQPIGRHPTAAFPPHAERHQRHSRERRGDSARP